MARKTALGPHGLTIKYRTIAAKQQALNLAIPSLAEQFTIYNDGGVFSVKKDAAIFAVHSSNVFAVKKGDIIFRVYSDDSIFLKKN